MGTKKSLADSSQFVKQTLIHSPIFTNIFPTFNVDVAKKFKGLPGNSIDESDQYLAPNEDSQMDAFDDDDEDFSMIASGVTGSGAASVLPAKHSLDKVEPELVTIKIIIKITSILVNNVEYSFPAPIRSSCMVNGNKDRETGRYGEDSLLISLKSGFLFLIRVFLVPREYNESFNGRKWDSKSSFNLVYKPFIVQWWDVGSDLQMPSLDSSGCQLMAHSSGLTAISTSASNVFRIYNSQLTDAGIVFGPHTNVPVDGIILNSSFAEPLPDCIDENHVMLLTLIFTENRRLELNLFEWVARELMPPTDLTKMVLPLNNSFPIPIFIIPLRKNTSFLFVSELDLTIISIHQIMSVEYDFHVKSVEQISFPTCYYIPFSNISEVTDDLIDEVILASDSGCIYSVLVKNNEEITIRLIARISDPISVFAIERVGKEYSIIYGSDTGSNRELLIGKLFDEDISLLSNTNKKYSKTVLITDYKNWAPLLDVLIMDSFKLRSLTNYIDQELWTLSGIGKRTCLSQVRCGYNTERIGKIYSKLRKAEKIFVQEVNDRVLFLLSYPFHTKVFEYFDDPEDADDMLIDMDDLEEEDQISIILDEPTIAMSKITNSTHLQITNNSICVTNLARKFSVKEFSRKIIFSDIMDSYVLLVSEWDGDSEDGFQTVLEIMEIIVDTDDIEESTEISEVLKLMKTINLVDEPSMAKFFKVDDNLFVSIGNFDGVIDIKGIFKSSFDTKIILNDFNPYEQGIASGSENLNIPHDIFLHIVGSINQMSIGTKDGYLINLSVALDGDHPLKVECSQFLKVSDTAVEFCEISEEPMTYFILSRNLWLVNLYQSIYPQKVFFNENTDKAIFSMIPLKLPRYILEDKNSKILTSFLNYFVYLREDGLSIGTIHTAARMPSIKQTVIGEFAKKMMYLPFLSSFIILCESKNANSRIKFYDRKLLKHIKHVEYNKNKVVDFVIGDDEIPTALSIWSIQRQDQRTSKKVLIGFSTESMTKGLIKILDISSNQNSDGALSITVTELNSFEWKDPITCISQIGESIIFTSGNSINSTSYNIAERKLNSIRALVSLSSKVISMSTNKETGEILVTTNSDSVYKFKHRILSFIGADGVESVELLAKDPSPKSLINQAQLSSGEIAVADKLHSSVIVMDTKDKALGKLFNERMSCIPRVFGGTFKNIWESERTNDSQTDLWDLEVNSKLDEETEKSETTSSIISVGVNGEVTVFRKLRDQKVTAILEDLNLPFTDKLNGKGLFSFYKPYFNYRENKGPILDLDLESSYDIGSINLSI